MLQSMDMFLMEDCSSCGGTPGHDFVIEHAHKAMPKFGTVILEVGRFK